MAKRPARKFTLLDAMILVGAAGVVFLGIRQLFSEDTDEIDSLSFGAELFPWPYWLTVGFRVAGLVLMVASITLLILRLVGPRPPIRRVMRQPGTVACFFAVACSLLRFAVRNVAEWSIRLFSDRPRITVLGIPTKMSENPTPAAVLWEYLLPALPSVTPCLVATAWIALWLGRTGRPEPGWIDRCGRAVGWLWIAWGVVGAIH
jgi:hypothetical protein